MHHLPFGWYWLAFFVALTGSALLSAFAVVRPGRTTEPPVLLHLARAVIGLSLPLLILSMPAVTGIPWYLPVAFLAAIAVLWWLPRRDVSRGWNLVRLSSVASWFLTAAYFALVFLLTAQVAWWITAVILFAMAGWNFYSEFYLKPQFRAMHSRYDDETIWSGLFLPEEMPILVMQVPALLFFPAPFGDVTAHDLRQVFLAVLPFFGLLLASVLGISVFAASSVRNGLKGDATIGVLRGTALMLSALIIVGLGASMSTRGSVGFDLARWSVPSVLSREDLSSLALWTMTASLAACVLPSLLVIVAILARKPEYDAFISFAGKDHGAAHDLYERVRSAGMAAFFSRESIVPGEIFPERIRNAIGNSREMVVLLTPNSVENAWVRLEYSTAFLSGMRVCGVLDGVERDQVPSIFILTNTIRYDEFDRYLDSLAKSTRRA